MEAKVQGWFKWTKRVELRLLKRVTLANEKASNEVFHSGFSQASK